VLSLSPNRLSRSNIHNESKLELGHSGLRLESVKKIMRNNFSLEILF